jgi:aminoglycoside phosphotransferase (APT) family kinase protein
MNDIVPALQAIMHRATGTNAPVENLTRLSGGANMESSSFDYAGQGYVLRRAPSAAFMEGRAFGHDVEAALVRAAHAAGVLAPEIVAELTPADAIGTGYIMRRVEAEVNPATILANPPPSLTTDIARELARIHAIGPRAGIAIPHMDTAAALAELKARFISFGGDRPIIALAFRWCEEHLPAPTAPVLVHGDFRMGNLMVDTGGLAAVLDWELAHWGDAHEDLAYGCMAVWRSAILTGQPLALLTLRAILRPMRLPAVRRWTANGSASGWSIAPYGGRWAACKWPKSGAAAWTAALNAPSSGGGRAKMKSTC